MGALSLVDHATRLLTLEFFKHLHSVLGDNKLYALGDDELCE